MKLLFFISDMGGGGAQRVLVNITNELIARGYEVLVVSNIAGCSYDIDSRVKIRNIPHIDRHNGREGIGELVRKVKNERSRWAFVNQTIRSFEPDVIITFLHCNMLPIIVYHHNIPIIHSEHNAFNRKTSALYCFRRFVLNRQFDKVFVLTPYDKGYAEAKGLHNTIVMPNPNSFETLDENEYKEMFVNRRNILACGRVNQWHIKGFDLAIKAFALIARKFDGIDLDIAGEASEQSIEFLSSLAEREGVRERVHFLGRCSNIRDLMRKHQVFMLSSRTEGFPMVITEAMSQGLPCVSFEGLSSSIIIDGIDGLLIRDGDVDLLSQGMEKIVSNEEMRFNMGLSAIRNVNRFSQSAICDKWESVIDEIKRI